MTFLNPILLWALPAALLPILIHLLNRLRYKTVPWAAMIFLISATRSSTRNARLRHYLILAMRTLAILLLVLALARPLVGGWFGMTLAGSPDTIMILLDRSASMEATDPRLNLSKRAHALNLFAEAGNETRVSSRFVLIENVLLEPQEIASPSVLADLSLTGPTDTAADIPSMLQAALEYMIDNQAGRTEIWIASDLQSSNWNRDSERWASLAGQIDALAQDVRVRLLVLSDDYSLNASVALHDISRRTIQGESELALALDLARTRDISETFPVTITLDGVRAQVDLEMEKQTLRHHRKLDLPPDQAAGGWGKIEIPADENLRDNETYFVYGGDIDYKATVVFASERPARFLQLAAAPAPGLLNRTADSLLQSAAGEIEWPELSMLIWQAGEPAKSLTNAVANFVKSGGSVMIFPPDQADTDSLFGLHWGAIELADSDPHIVSVWEENEGPLANTENNESLSVASLSITRRQVANQKGRPSNEDPNPIRPLDDWTVLASYADGQPFLLRKLIGKGRAYICTTLPDRDWSNLGQGTVLLPMIQRVLERGGKRLSPAEIGVCGEWEPLEGQEVWMPVDVETSRDPRWQAGVYAAGTRKVALNRPALEDTIEVLDKDDAAALFDPLQVQVLEELSGRSRDQLQSEIWPIFIYIALICLLIEAGLLLSEKASVHKDKEKTAMARAKI